MKIFYYSATGNSLHVARKLGGELVSIPKLLKEGLKLEFKADKIGIVFPCNYLGLPRMVKEFLSKAKLESDYVFAIMTYGNYSGGALDMLKAAASAANIKLSYLNEILMIDNYLPMFEMNRQKEGAAEKNIDESLRQIVSDVKKGEVSLKLYGPARTLISRVAAAYHMLRLKNADSRFTVEDSCNGCGLCEKVCPAANIVMINKRPEYQGHCEECMACTQLCPQNSIRIKGEKSTERWINEHVKAKDIADSNYSAKTASDVAKKLKADEKTNSAARVTTGSAAKSKTSVKKTVAKKVISKTATVKTVKAAPKSKVAPKAVAKKKVKAQVKKAVKAAKKSVKAKAAPKAVKQVKAKKAAVKKAVVKKTAGKKKK